MVVLVRAVLREQAVVALVAPALMRVAQQPLTPEVVEVVEVVVAQQEAQAAPA